MARAEKPTPANLVRFEAKGKALLKPIESNVKDLEVTTPEEYQAADELRGLIDAKMKAWDGEMEAILAPLRDAKTAADALKRKVRKPLEDFRAHVTTLMTDFKRAELEAKAEADRKRDEELAKLNKQIEDTAAREDTARTAQMRERLAKAREALEAKAEEVAEDETPVTTAEHSTVRRVKHWRLSPGMGKQPRTHEETLLLVCKGITSGLIPTSAIMLDNSAINKLTLQPGGWETIAQWPGFEVYDDISIVGRGR